MSGADYRRAHLVGRGKAELAESEEQYFNTNYKPCQLGRPWLTTAHMFRNPESWDSAVSLPVPPLHAALDKLRDHTYVLDTDSYIVHLKCLGHLV